MKMNITRILRKSIEKGNRKIIKILQLLHGELYIPMEPVSIEGAKYFIIVYCYYSSVSAVQCLSHISEMGKKLKDFIAGLEFVTNDAKLRATLMGNFGEFTTKITLNWLRARGISPIFLSTYSPSSNVRAERLNRTLLEKARAMLHSS